MSAGLSAGRASGCVPISRAMQPRLALVATLALASCNSHGGGAGSGPASVAIPGPPAAPGLPATAWIPAHPTYAVAAHSVRELQQTARHLIGSLGIPAGLDEATVSGVSSLVLGLDLLAPESLAGAGVDPEGGVAVFSEELSPTFVIHLKSVDQMTSFLRRRGPAPVTATIGGVEIRTLAARSAQVSWAISHDWLWLHVALGPSEGTAWFEHSRAGGGGVLPDWAHAQVRGRAPVVAFADLHALVAAGLASMPGAPAECARRFEALGHLDAGFDFDERHVAAHVSVEVGPDALALAAHVLAPPGGWDATAAQAPLAVAWNADLGAVAPWLRPCLGDAQPDLFRSGLRSARVAVFKFEGMTSFSGVGVADLSNPAQVTALLDQIPLRSHLEHDRTYGPYKGHHISIPTMFALDYVVTPQLAAAAVGDGVLERALAGAPAAHAPVATVDVHPQAMPAADWTALVHTVGFSPRVVSVLTSWRALHLAATVEGSEVVIEASAERN